MSTFDLGTLCKNMQSIQIACGQNSFCSICLSAVVLILEDKRHQSCRLGESKLDHAQTIIILIDTQPKHLPKLGFLLYFLYQSFPSLRILLCYFCLC